MTIHLRRDMDDLKREILSVGALVEELINKSIAALLDRRTELLREVYLGDEELDRLEVMIEEKCLKVLALHQPVADDLRYIVAVMKVNNDLERMGDLAANIARRVEALSKEQVLKPPIPIQELTERAQSMVRKSLDSLVNHDVGLAWEVLKEDQEVDELHRKMYVSLQELMKLSPDNVDRATSTLSVSRYLERIADLATNVAEDVIFMVEGKIVRHIFDEPVTR